MIKSLNSLFTIGQFAAIPNINKKTLMWYDQVDLLKPVVVKENGYRYYSFSQSTTLETILMLRKLDVSIKDIKYFLKDPSAKTMTSLLDEKIRNIDEKINHLLDIKNLLVHKHQNMSKLLTLNISEIEVVNLPAKNLLLIPTEATASTESEIESILDVAKENNLQRLHDANYGSLLAIEDIISGNFENYNYLFMELPEIIKDINIHIRPAGLYLRGYHQGSWDGLADKYIEITNFANSHGYSLTGYAYETCINEDVIETMNDYITQIEISVKSE